MSGMDRLTDEQLHPLTMIDGSVGAMARELLAHRRASQAAPAEEWEACTCGPCPLHPAAPAPSDGLREAAIEELYGGLMQRHADYMSSKGRNPVDYSSPWSMAAEVLSGMTDAGIKPSPVSKVILEHSGCGYSTQVEQLTVRLEPGDKVLLVKPARATPAPAQEGCE